jgi:hypothetical protein
MFKFFYNHHFLKDKIRFLNKILNFTHLFIVIEIKNMLKFSIFIVRFLVAFIKFQNALNRAQKDKKTKIL